VLAPELVVADLDRAELRPCTAHDSFPANVAMLTAFAPPAATLLARLQACVSPERFDEVAVQAACMQFLADMLNLHDGALSDSKHGGDVVALQKWALLRDFEEDVCLRCTRDSDVAPYCDKLRPKLREALSASLATVCEQATAPLYLPCISPASPPHLPRISPASPLFEQATAGLSMLNTRQRPVAPFLALVYGSRAFRQWWITAETACSQELKMCLGYRENDLNLADHLGDHKRALQLVEASLFDGVVEADEDSAPTTPTLARLPSDGPPPPG